MVTLDCPAYAAGSVRSGPDRTVNRPNTAPAYYLGHPASLWLTAMHPHRSRTAPGQPVPVVPGGGRTRSRPGLPVGMGRNRRRAASTSRP